MVFEGLIVKPIQCCSMDVAPCMIDLNVTTGTAQVAFKLMYDFNGFSSSFSFGILSDSSDN